MRHVLSGDETLETLHNEFMLKNTLLVFMMAFMGCAHSSSRTDSSSVDSHFAEELINVQSIAARLEPVITKQIGEQGNVGAVVGIYHGGQIKYLTLGEVKKGSKTPPTEETLFEIGSITKTMTGLLLAIAIEEGKIKETKTLGEVKKEWKTQKTADITLVELAQHRAGLQRLPCNLKPKNMKDPYAEYSEKDLIQSLKDSSFSDDCLRDDHPTKKRVYSNWGMSLLGYAVSDVQKTTYPNLFQQKIAKPLEFTNTTAELKKEQKSKMAQGYDDHQNEAPMWSRNILYGQGSVISNAKDMMNFAQAYLAPDSTPIEKAIRRSKDYAWMKTASGSLWHNGGTGGFSSMMKIYPAHDLAVFYLTNTSKEFKCFISTVESVPCE